jgi:hypothetical protein
MFSIPFRPPFVPARSAPLEEFSGAVLMRFRDLSVTVKFSRVLLGLLAVAQA